MMNNISLSQWIENFNAGCYDSKDLKIQIDAGWFDWFCNSKSLRNKTYTLASKVKRIAKSTKVNINTMYVLFKNNCPLNGSLYDDFRICDLKTGDVIFTITPSCGHKNTKGLASVWGFENDFTGTLVEGTWKDVCKWFGV